MSLKLRHTDALAVDLILDRAAAAQGNGNGGGQTTLFGSASSHVGVSNDQVAAVEKFLHLLDKMPAAEPGQDLLQRTLARVDTSDANAPVREHGHMVIDHGRPVA